jgi:hypothetical protein
LGEALGFLCACDFGRLARPEDGVVRSSYAPTSRARFGPNATESRRIQSSGADCVGSVVARVRYGHTELNDEFCVLGPPDRG